MLVPAIMVPFVLADSFSLPKALLLQLMVVCVAIAWLGKTVVAGHFTIEKIGIHPAMILFAAVLIVTTFMSVSSPVSLFGNYLRHEGLITWLAYIIVFLAAATHVAKAEIEKWLKVGLAVALPISIYALIQFLGWDFMPLSAEADPGRVFSTLGNPVYLGAYLVLVLPLALSLALTVKSRLRYLYVAVLILGAMALIFTYTRAAWIGTAVSLAVIVFVHARELNRRNLVLVFSVVSIVVVMTTMLFLVKPEKAGVYSRIAASFNLSAGSVGERLGFWRTSLSVVRERPLFGWGLETFGDVSWPHRPDDVNGRPPRADRPHNQFLYMASSLGLIGLTAYLWLLAVIFRRIWRGVRENEDAGDRYLATGIFAAGLGYIVQEQFSFSQVETAPLFWLLMGLGVVLSKPTPVFKKYDFRTRPAASVIGTAVLSVGLVILALTNLSFFAADYHYKKYLTGQEGETALSRAVAINPYQNTYRHALGKHLFELGRMSSDNTILVKAANELEKALLVNSLDKVVSANLAATYAILAESDGSYVSKAIGAYRRVLRIDPMYTAGHRSLAILSINSGQNKQALIHLKKWLSAEPENGEALYYKGVIFDNQDRKALAIEYYRRAAKVNTPFAKEAAAHLELLRGRH